MDVDQLRGSRILLRKFTPADAPMVQALAGDPAVADTTLNVPHPYPDGAAEQWIATHPNQFQEGTGAVFAIATLPDHALVGCITVGVNRADGYGEIGYCIGRNYWGLGYCTDALHLFLDYCFLHLGLHRVYARHFARNPASGRVMQKVGMQREVQLRQHVLKAGRYEDLILYGLLRSEYQSGP